MSLALSSYDLSFSVFSSIRFRCAARCIGIATHSVWRPLREFERDLRMSDDPRSAVMHGSASVHSDLPAELVIRCGKCRFRSKRSGLAEMSQIELTPMSPQGIPFFSSRNRGFSRKHDAKIQMGPCL